MTVLLEAKDLKKLPNGQCSRSGVQGITFDVAEGEFVAVFGPSGSEKSTLLHVLGGLDRPEVEHATITPIFSWSWVIIAVIFGISIYKLFGLYPARKVAKLDPVEALRYE